MSEASLEVKNTTAALSEKKKVSPHVMKYIHSAIGIGFMVGFPMLPPIEPITEVGMHVLAIFVGMVYLWSTVNSIWPSILGLFLMAMSGFAPLSEVARGAFGADIVVLMLLSMIFFGGVEYAGCTQYMARWFVTRKIINGRPYAFLFIFFLASYFLSGLTDPIASLFILWPIAVELMQEFGVDRNQKVYGIAIFGVYLAATLGQPMFPFKGAALVCVGTFQAVTGIEVNYLAYVLLNLVLSLAVITVFMLLLKFVFKPDLSALKNINAEQFKKNPLPPMNMRQKLFFFSIFAYVILLLAPSFLPKTWAITNLLNSMGVLGITFMFVVVLMIIHVDGKPALPFGEVAVKNFSWDVYFLVVAALYGANAVSNDATGIKEWLLQVLQPLLGDRPEIIFIALLLVFIALVTNVANNAGMVVILIPIVMAFSSQYPAIEPVALMMLITYLAFFAILTPAASPYAGMMHARRDLIDFGAIIKMGTPIIVIGVVLCATVGYKLAALLF